MLKKLKDIDLPRKEDGEFDHGDVHAPSGRVFVANTAAGTVEVIDGVALEHVGTVEGCHEASGVLCAEGEEMVFAAARATGKVLVIDPNSLETIRVLEAGNSPNGIAWDSSRKNVAVADVKDNNLRLFGPHRSAPIATFSLPGRPRWCAYDKERDRFLVNIREPAGVCAVSTAKDGLLSQTGFMAISGKGPHGLAIDADSHRGFVACDSAELVTFDLSSGAERTKMKIAGAPDVIWFNPVSNEVYCAIGDKGVIQVIDAAGMKIVQELQTEKGTHTFAFDETRQKLYAFLPSSCKARVFSF
jgi:DNA-binding beta-propeller fold protein YncE